MVLNNTFHFLFFFVFFNLLSEVLMCAFYSFGFRTQWVPWIWKRIISIVTLQLWPCDVGEGGRGLPTRRTKICHIFEGRPRGVLARPRQGKHDNLNSFIMWDDVTWTIIIKACFGCIFTCICGSWLSIKALEWSVTFVIVGPYSSEVTLLADMLPNQSCDCSTHLPVSPSMVTSHFYN